MERNRGRHVWYKFTRIEKIKGQRSSPSVTQTVVKFSVENRATESWISVCSVFISIHQSKPSKTVSHKIRNCDLLFLLLGENHQAQNHKKLPIWFIEVNTLPPPPLTIYFSWNRPTRNLLLEGKCHGNHIHNQETKISSTKREQEAVTRTANTMVLKILFCERVVQSAFSERRDI